MKNTKRFFVFLIVTGIICFIAGGAWAADAGGKINLNTATVDQLIKLKGIGPALADRIVADRVSKGPFKTVNDLVRVKGIGPKVLAGIKDQVIVSASEKMSKPEKE